MLNGIKQYLFLVVDQETKGILCKCISANVANAVSQGITNSSPMTIHQPHISHSISKYNDDLTLNYQLIRKVPVGSTSVMGSEVNVARLVPTSDPRGFDVVDLKLTDGWLERRQLAVHRADKIKNLESACDRYMSRAKTFCGDEMFYQYLGKQLSQVNGSYYPPSIVEWAEINDLPLEDAYQELKMSYESAGIIIMRINAVWRKYVNLINSITEEEYNASDITAQFEAALRFGSTK